LTIDRALSLAILDPQQTQSGPTECVPIGAIFAVLNWTHVDLISLDTETTESHIIVALPFASVRVDVFLIERRAGNFNAAQEQKLQFVLTFMKLMGFRHAELIKELDDVFVRNDFVY
jgi:hypothetical protein